MDDETPPKRVTRARAAARTNSTVELSVKIATAASKAKVTRKATTTKKNTRNADAEEEEHELTDEHMEDTKASEPPRASRGRPRKAAAVTPTPEIELAVEDETAPPAKATRGRAKKVLTEEPAAESAKSTRGRPKKTESAVESEPVHEPVNKVTRGRAATSTKIKAAPKKSVKFVDSDEVDKENILPSIAVDGKTKKPQVVTGFTSKPARQPVASTRTTRGRTKLSESEGSKEKAPLSPKKATQVATAKENVSEDELATMEKTPMKPLTKSPLKFSTLGTAKKLDFTTSIIAGRAQLAPTQTLGNSILGSPARRPPPSPYKDALKTSPKRLHFGEQMTQSPFKTSLAGPKEPGSPFKRSLLQSPARRPASPTKTLGSPGKCGSALNSMPRANTLSISRFATPKALARNAVRPGKIPFATDNRPTTDIPKPDFTAIEPFSGRLSSVLPRHVDPVMRGEGSFEVPPTSGPGLIDSIRKDESSTDSFVADPMEVDVDLQGSKDVEDEGQSTTPSNSPPRYSVGNYGLRDLDQDPFGESDSEDELASASPKYSPAPLSMYKISSKDFASPSTPTPAAYQTPTLAQKSTARDIFSVAKSQSVRAARREQNGFTPLAKQLSDWMAASPERPEDEINEIHESITSALYEQVVSTHVDTGVEKSPVKSSFFEDEMSVRDDASTADANILDALDFAPAEIDEEDMALVAEANEMSIIGSEDFDEVDVVDDDANLCQPQAPSEISEEYGDENAIPIDPALLALDIRSSQSSIVTPARVLTERIFHTVSKVPLKPAAEDSPVKATSHKRSASVSRLPVQRSALSAASPVAQRKVPLGELNLAPMVLTPAKSSNWSIDATPTRTPRRDLNDQVLKGAVVFVDVHTSEGADASTVFVELLGQMGAKCVKSWTWNPNNQGSSPLSEDGTGTCPKIGITHVVFKDGGKRTLEKVRESKGVVLCVGVGWVLDCERTNTWLNEAIYGIDTALVPRGGHRRRKSMEPRAIANMNGTLVSTPGRSASYTYSPTKEFLNIPDTPASSLKTNRRASTVWVRSPKDDTSEDIPELSPVPKTPAPESISAYADHLLDEESGVSAETPYFLRKEDLVQMTAPPKQMDKSYGVLTGDASGDGTGVLMQRLMLARRKSLQWAPKVGSPLARGASYGL